jgi:hypothetical protein
VSDIDGGKLITDFVDFLAEDTDRQYLFEHEPVAIMTSYGLNARQQRLLLDGSIEDLRQEIRNELGNENAPVVAIMIRKK